MMLEFFIGVILQNEDNRYYTKPASFGFLFLLQLLNLTPLLLDLLLLRLHLLLGLLARGLVILHLVTDCISGHPAERAADCRADRGSAHRGSDDRAGGSADTRASQGAFFTGRERLPRASGHQKNRG
jgi:hypothetical protein